MLSKHLDQSILKSLHAAKMQILEIYCTYGPCSAPLHRS